MVAEAARACQRSTRRGGGPRLAVRSEEGFMRIGAILSPVADWGATADAARAADPARLDAIGLWDHYHSGRPEWAYIAGWSAYGSLAAITSHVRLVPMVLNTLHFEPGVLAKE